MHGLDTIRALNKRVDENYNQLTDELRSNVELLRAAPQMTAYERQVLHYSEMLQRIAAGESFAHVAQQMGPAVRTEAR